MGGMVQVPFGDRLVSRLEPAMPAGDYQTYGLSMPLATHWRAATCEEAECEAYLNGWVSTFDLGSDLGRAQYTYCKGDRTRSFTVQRDSLTLIRFTYGPGNRCFRFRNHHVPLARPARYTVTGGDWRGNPRGVPTRTHRRAEDWIEDFATHQDKIATAISRG